MEKAVLSHRKLDPKTKYQEFIVPGGTEVLDICADEDSEGNFLWWVILQIPLEAVDSKTYPKRVLKILVLYEGEEVPSLFDAKKGFQSAGFDYLQAISHDGVWRFVFYAIDN